MSHPIEQRIRVLRARVRRLVTVYGLSWIVAAVLGAVIVLGVTDYLIRFQDRGLRVICSLLVVGALGWTCYRYLYLALIVRLRDVDLAVRLQRRFPALEDRLVSSVEFLKQSEDDPVAGSPALRRAVIAQTSAETDRLDFAEVLDARPPVRAAMATVSICLVAAILFAFDFKASWTAVARVVNPFTDRTYPQEHHLMLCDQVRRVARGQAFEVEVVDREGAKLPKEVRIHYRFEDPDGATSPEPELMHFVPGATATRGLGGAAAELRKKGVMVARRENVIRPFSYWVEGGDDSSMAYRPISVEVVEPPALESLRVKLVPPEYTGWPSETAKSELIRALVGTRVEISAKATRPLKSALLHLEGGRQIDGGPTGRQRRKVAAEFVIEDEELDSVSLKLADQEDLSGEVDWEIRAVPDEPPTVSIEQPSDTVFVTSEAVVPLRVAAKDDLAIREMALVFSTSDRPEQEQPDESVLPLYTGPERVESQPAGGLSGRAELGDRRVIAYRWELAGLELPPGTQLTFHATATDYRPQPGKSRPKRLIVITPEELQDRIAGRQSLILAELTRVLKMQRGSRSQVKSLEIRLNEIGHLERFDVDRLQAAELNQRQLNHSLTSPSEGVPKQILTLLADLENNKVDSPDVQRRMETLLGEIDRLEGEHLAVIGRELTAAIKAAQVLLQRQSEPPGRDAAVAGSVAEAGKQQDQVIASLERMLSQLGQWDNYRRFHREIGQLLRDQEALRLRTTEVGRRTLTKDLKDLPPQDVADLKTLAARQLELARQLDRIQQGMEQAVDQLQQSDPLAAETVADALSEALRLAISGQMRSSAGHLDRNQIGQAVGRQKQIAQDLQEVLDILANRRQHELARLVKKLVEAEGDLAEIERRQAELGMKMEENAQEPDDAERRRELQRLGREQAQLQQETERMARRLKRLLADRAGQTVGLAAARMCQAAECAGQGNCQGACREAQAAEENLAEARRQLAQRRRQAQAELAREQLARLEDTLKHLSRRQQNVIGETQRFDGLQARGHLTRAQTVGLRDLAGQQGLLQAETIGLGDKLVGAETFQLALSGAARDMGRAAAMLDQRQTGPATQQAETDALRRLGLLLEALKPEKPDAEPGGAGGAGRAGGGAKGQGAPPGGALPNVAELKLLKLLQQEISVRTKQLQEAVDKADTLTDQQRRQHTALSEEQGQLADLVLELLQPEQQDPEDEPAGLPDMRLDQQEGPQVLPLEEELP